MPTQQAKLPQSILMSNIIALRFPLFLIGVEQTKGPRSHYIHSSFLLELI